MAGVDAYRQIVQMWREMTPRIDHGFGMRFTVDESEPTGEEARSMSRSVRVFPVALGTNAVDQTPGNRRTFCDIVCEVYYRPSPRARTTLIEACITDYEAARDYFMDTLNWDSSTSGIIALNVGGLEIQPADVTYQEAGTVLALTLSVEYEDPQ